MDPVTMTVHVASKAQIDRLAELVEQKLGGALAIVFNLHLAHDVVSVEQADHEIADLSALPNRRNL